MGRRRNLQTGILCLLELQGEGTRFNGLPRMDCRKVKLLEVSGKKAAGLRE